MKPNVSKQTKRDRERSLSDEAAAAQLTGAFLPPLYEYSVVAAFFSSPLDSNWIVPVTPLKLAFFSSGMYFFGSVEPARVIASTSTNVASYVYGLYTWNWFGYFAS